MMKDDELKQNNSQLTSQAEEENALFDRGSETADTGSDTTNIEGGALGSAGSGTGLKKENDSGNIAVHKDAGSQQPHESGNRPTEEELLGYDHDERNYDNGVSGLPE